MPETSAGEPAALDRRLYLGTSSFSSKDWNGVFYPEGMAPSSYLSFYATRFRTVEVDATFYRVPSAVMTNKWRRDLPDGFLLAAKAPQVITHEKGLLDCRGDVEEFLEAMDNLGDRLGPLLFQFPYYKRGSEMTREIFLDRLAKFLPSLSKGYRFALEIRNKAWLTSPFLDLLRANGVALALIDHPWMPLARQYMELDSLTADFAYIRWLGDRYEIERTTKTWEKVIVDRTREMKAWVPVVREIIATRRTVFAFFNNHFAGHAPGSIDLFEKVWKATP